MTRIANKENTLNSYSISPDEIRIGDKFGYKIIAVVYGEKLWCAYRGMSHWTDKEVADRGDEVPYVIAQWLFPTVASAISFHTNN